MCFSSENTWKIPYHTIVTVYFSEVRGKKSLLCIWREFRTELVTHVDWQGQWWWKSQIHSHIPSLAARVHGPQLVKGEQVQMRGFCKCILHRTFPHNPTHTAGTGDRL